MLPKILLALISGLLTALSFIFPKFSFVIWFALVPLFHLISKSKTKQLIFCGFLFGLAFYGASIFWVGNVTKLGLIFLLTYLSLYTLSFALLGRYFLKKPLSIITLPCLWVILEFLKESVWCGFSWANLGYSQYNNFYLIQIADLWGTKFISFLIVMFNFLIWEMVCYSREGGKRISKAKNMAAKVSLVFIIFLSTFLYSFYRLDQLDSADSLEIAVIQPNIAQDLKWDPSASSYIIDKLNILGKETPKNSLVIFPEAAWPFTVDEDSFEELGILMSDIQRDAIIGVVSREGDIFYNSALLFNKKGEVQEFYHKIMLVPFGEYVPLRKYLGFISVINSIGDISRGDILHKFSYKNRKFAMLICFEDIFPLHVLSMARESDFLINITNDAWFGGEPEASQHLSIMTLRAVENRISIVRSANTGISGWVSYRGKIKKLTKDKKELFFADSRTFNISLTRKRSFYNKYPEVFVGFCLIFLVAVVLIFPALSSRELS